MCHYQAPNIVSQRGKWKVRYLHTVGIETDEGVGKLKWARSDQVVRASLVTSGEAKGSKGKRRSREQTHLVVLVPDQWKLIETVEKPRDDTDKDVISDLVATSDSTQLLAHFDLEEREPETKARTRQKEKLLGQGKSRQERQKPGANNQVLVTTVANWVMPRIAGAGTCVAC